VDIDIKKYLELNKKLYNISTSALKAVYANGIPDTRIRAYRLIALLILVKNRKHFRAVQELCSLGYGEEASILVRSMTNALIDLAYINCNGKIELSRRFILYDWVIKKRKISNMDIIDKARAPKPLSREELKRWEDRKKEVYAEVEKFNKKFNVKNKNDWSGYTIRTKAEKAGKNIELLYHTIYAYNSNIEHGNVDALDKYIKTTDYNEINLLCEASDKYVKRNLSDSFNIFSNIVKIFCKAFRLNNMDKITEQELVNEFVHLYKDNEASKSK